MRVPRPGGQVALAKAFHHNCSAPRQALLVACARQGHLPHPCAGLQAQAYLSVEQARRDVISDGHQHVLNLGPLLGRGRLARLLDRLTQPLLCHLAQELGLSSSPAPCPSDENRGARQRSSRLARGPLWSASAPPLLGRKSRSIPGMHARTGTAAGGAKQPPTSAADVGCRYRDREDTCDAYQEGRRSERCRPTPPCVQHRRQDPARARATCHPLPSHVSALPVIIFWSVSENGNSCSVGGEVHLE